jgi:hypothetical protein
MVNRRMRATVLVTATCVDSARNDGVQLADLMAGAVAHQCGQANKPTSLAEPPIASTAKGIATNATALPVPEMTSQVSSSLKLRLRSAPRASAPCGSAPRSSAPRGNLIGSMVTRFAAPGFCLLSRRNHEEPK